MSETIAVEIVKRFEHLNGKLASLADVQCTQEKHIVECPTVRKVTADYQLRLCGAETVDTICENVYQARVPQLSGGLQDLFDLHNIFTTFLERHTLDGHEDRFTRGEDRFRQICALLERLGDLRQ